MVKRSIEDLLGNICGACHKSFATTQGLCAHQSMSQLCAWYKKGKLKEIFEDTGDVQEDFVAEEGG